MAEAPAGTDGGADPEDTIVVGVDGSAESIGAARWAAAEAARSGHRVVLLSAWQYPMSWGATIPLPDGYDPAADARALLDPVTDGLRAEFPLVEINNRIVEGHPAEVLVEASRHAPLLVVASRGHGAFTGMLLGSVSQHCAAYAHSPVLVYRASAGD
jgi:nucleotide-binding universal stress UspA family protein